MAGPLSPPPVRHFKPGYLPAYLSNGLIGLRAGPLPLLQGVCIVSGLAGRDPVGLVEAFARAPYPLAGDVEIDGSHLRRLPEQAQLVEQSYDFESGELRTSFRFSTARVRAEVEVTSFCSRTQPTCVLQETRVTVDRECDLAVSAGIEPGGVPGRYLERRTATPDSEKPVVDGFLEWETYAGVSSCGAAYTTAFQGPGFQKQVLWQDEAAPLKTTYGGRAEAGRTYVLRQLTSLVPRQLHSDPDLQALRLASLATARGWERLRADNRAAWAEVWHSRILLHGAGDEWQRLADAAFYYLHASAHRSSLFSTAMFGLAYWPNFHYYRGHVMWDIEAFSMPPLLLTDPESARALLEYRASHLDAAERHAAMGGYSGLQFPWEAGPLAGDEQYRVNEPLIGFEQHVSLSVALAFARFVHVTGDEDFLRDRAWPVLSGVARWLESRVSEGPGGLEIREVVGVAEHRSPINNNAFTNMGAVVALREAAAFAERLGYPASARRWSAMAERVVIPMKGAVILNHDESTPPDGGSIAATPEALGGLLLFDFPAPQGVVRATLEDQLSRIEDYIGRPMLSAPLGVAAARLGDRRRSLELFQAGYAEFVNEPWLTVNEFSRTRFPDKPVVGPLFANLGGFLQSLLYGLPGIHVDAGEPERWPRRPVVLPEGWEAIECGRIHVRGERSRLIARHGAERASIERAD